MKAVFVSRKSTARTVNPLARFASRIRWRAGNSAWHAVQEVAQKLISTGRPLKSERLTGRPLRSHVEKPGALPPTAANPLATVGVFGLALASTRPIAVAVAIRTTSTGKAKDHVGTERVAGARPLGRSPPALRGAPRRPRRRLRRS